MTESRQEPPDLRSGIRLPRGSEVGSVKRIPRFHGLAIARLDLLLAKAWHHRLTLIVAPAGSGKTTLAARFAASAKAPVAWYRAESWDREPARMLHHVEVALASALDGVSGGWETADDALAELEYRPAEPCLLVVDDLHTLESTEAERELERLLDHVPWLTLICASRVPPNFNLPRLRLSGEMLEIGGDELRMRSWEVEQLFHDFYEEQLPPEELAYLARRTEGWAAGLQLFHLASRGKPPDERRRLLHGLGPGSRVMRDYLARNVLHDLPNELRRFLVESSVLGRLTGPLCDRLLRRNGSARLLDELVSRCLFTYALPDPGAFRYHEVFRSHLLGVLLETHGEAHTRRLHEAAGELLADRGAIPEALDAFCHAEAWDRVDHLLGRDGAAVAGRPTRWMDSIPPALLRHDPWLTLGSARRLRAQGRLNDAIDAYTRAEEAFGQSDSAFATRQERQSLTIWAQSDGTVTPDPWGLLRAATRRDPLAVRQDLGRLSGPAAGLAKGLATLASGHVRDARVTLLHTAEHPDSSGFIAVAASLAAGVASLLGGEERGLLEVEGALAPADEAGLDWLGRVGRAALALVNGDDSGNEAERVGEGCTAMGDDWGAAFCDLIVGWAAGESARGQERLEAASGAFRRLGAPVLEAWALALSALALVRAGDPSAESMVLRAEATARMTGTAAARLFSYEALAMVRTDDAEDFEAILDDLRSATGIRLPSWAVPSHAASERPSSESIPLTTAPRIRLRCFGGLELRIESRDVELASLRPRVRSLLRLLSAQAGHPVHDEVIQEAFWPNADPDTGARNLHVAVSALRRVLEPEERRGSFQLILREGDTYRLAISHGSDVDLLRFDEALAGARAAIRTGDRGTAEQAYSRALRVYQGELLADEGPADWLTEPRERRREEGTEAAYWVASARLARGDHEGAARACTDGLRIDRYHDPLWRTLIDARERAGDKGTAQRARAGYAAVLTELGVGVGEREP